MTSPFPLFPPLSSYQEVVGPLCPRVQNSGASTFGKMIYVDDDVSSKIRMEPHIQKPRYVSQSREANARKILTVSVSESESVSVRASKRVSERK